MPAAFITMISQSVDSLLSTWATAINSAIGAITRTSSGMIRPVMPTKTRMVWPWLVIRSMSRSACVTQITAVRLTSTTTNAPNVVRKIYRLIDPIRRVVPQSPACTAHRPAAAPGAKRNQPNPNPRQVYLDPSTKWPRKGKAVEHAQQKVKIGGRIRAARGVPLRPRFGPIRPSRRSASHRAAVKSLEIRASWGFAEGGAAGHMGRQNRLPARPKQDPGLRNAPMSDALKLGFAPFAAGQRAFSSCSATTGSNSAPPPRKALGAAADLVARAAKAEHFTGKSGSALELIVPEGLKVARLVVIGAGKASATWRRRTCSSSAALAMGKLPVERAAKAPCSPNCRAARCKAEQAADLAHGVRAARLRLRPLQDQAQGRREAAGKAQRDGRGRRRRRRAQGLRCARGDRRRRADGARSGQRAGQRALSGRIRPPHAGAEKSRRRGRGARRQGDEEARHERAARRRPGLGARKPRRGDALERRQNGRGAGRLHRQGRVLRHRRHLDQAGRRHGGHEGRHGGRGLRHRPACRRSPRARPRSTRSASSAWSRTCRTATRSGRATSSPRCRARPSRSSTPTPKAASCWPT